MFRWIDDERLAMVLCFYVLRVLSDFDERSRMSDEEKKKKKTCASGKRKQKAE